MATIETVTGPIDEGELGRTLGHEHFRTRSEMVVAQWPHLYDENAQRERALEDARAVMEHGVKSVCVPDAMLLGRDAAFLKEISEETGLQLVVATGIYTYEELPQYFVNRDVDHMADCFVHDIEKGIQGTDIKAGFLKCAADAQGVGENVEKVHRAVARASVQTGAPIMAHSRPASDTASRQVEIFVEEGVDPSRVQIAHTGDTDDVEYIERLLATGVWIGMDRYGLDMFLPTDRRNATVTELLARGHADRMFISQDFCATIDWFPEEAEEMLYEQGAVRRDWSMTLVFEEVVPALREAGVLTDEHFQTIFVDNPRRWLAG